MNEGRHPRTGLLIDFYRVHNNLDGMPELKEQVRIHLNNCPSCSRLRVDIMEIAAHEDAKSCNDSNCKMHHPKGEEK